MAADQAVSKEKEEIPQPLRVTRLTELRAGSDQFRSSGICRLKVTKDGVPGIIEVAIKSSGVADVVERLQVEEPKPPSKPELVTPDSPIGRSMKITKNTWMNLPDFGDAEYLEKMAKHRTKAQLAVICQGLDTPITDEAGAPVTDAEKKVEILRGLGMSMPQFTQMVNDIQDLTTVTDRDRTLFFGPSSASGETIQTA